MKIIENRTTDYINANFSEDETLWNSDDTYKYGDERRWGHYIYKYAGKDDTNTDINPLDDIANNVIPSWIKIAPTNYYAMLDGKTNTSTKVNELIEIEILDNNYDSLSLLGLKAQEVNIELYDHDSESVAFTESFNLQDESDVVDFYSYSFNSFNFTPVVYTQMPIFSNAKLKISIKNKADDVECGRLIFGRSFYVGDTGYNANLSLESYSRKVADEFGNVDLVHRGAVNLDSYEIIIPTVKVPMLKRKAIEFDAKPLLFVMDESDNSVLENLLNFGYWQNFSMLIPNATKSTISLTIKSLL